ncbi:MAG: HigA family addiction module antitoxin [Gammaproteobacteria bacterium]|nr:HigA family addiction module antitoxin [Gammaproteobacteria bacterium]
MRKPTHPGAVLRDDILPELEVSKASLARALDISRQMLYGILNEEKSVSAEMAVKLAVYFGNEPEMWLNMQMQCDLYKARKAIKGSVLKRIRKEGTVR